MMQSNYFHGRRVLVTGGGQGLGLAIVETFLSHGATVIALDKDQSLLDNLKQKSPSVEVVQVDLSCWGDTVAAIQKMRPIQHLINNAGILVYEPILEFTESLIDKMLSINFKAVLNTTQEFAKQAKDNKCRDASIVNISSIAGTKPARGRAMYSCSKSAVDMLTRCMAVELSEFGIRVNSVAPGAMETGMVAGLPNEFVAMAKEKGWFTKPLVEGFVKLEDVAELVVYLSSPQSAFVTGGIFPVDGGLSAL